MHSVAAAVRCAVRLRRDRLAVRPDQIRHSARSSGSARELPAGNALVEGATFIAILLGTIVGGIAAKGGGDPVVLRVLMMVFALLCWVSACSSRGPARPRPISSSTRTSSPRPAIADQASARRPAAVVGRAGHELVLARRRSWRCRCCRRWSRTCSAATRRSSTLYLAIFSIAIAVGSGLAAWLAAGRIILLPTLLGAVLLGIFSLDLGFATLGRAGRRRSGWALPTCSRTLRGIRVAIDLAGLAIAGGLFIVPAFAAVQAWAGADRRARVVAAVNVLNAAVHDGRRRWSSRCCRAASASPRRRCSC